MKACRPTDVHLLLDSLSHHVLLSLLTRSCHCFFLTLSWPSRPFALVIFYSLRTKKNLYVTLSTSWFVALLPFSFQPPSSSSASRRARVNSD